MVDDPLATNDWKCTQSWAHAVHFVHALSKRTVVTQHETPPAKSQDAANAGNPPRKTVWLGNFTEDECERLAEHTDNPHSKCHMTP